MIASTVSKSVSKCDGPLSNNPSTKSRCLRAEAATIASANSYPQLFSRVGFAHQYRPLQDREFTFVLTRRWRDLGLTLDDADFTDTQAIAAIVRITGGNFRLLHRLFIQIERILRLNELTAITEDVVEAARSTLVIGVT